MRKILLILSLSFISVMLFSQDEESEFDFLRKTMNIYSTQEKIEIDGILDENTWQTTTVYSDFYQQQPLDGIIAEHKTEVQICYDERNIYVAARVYDDKNFIVSTLKRDNFDGSDAFGVALDPQNQKQNGFAFGVNVMGAPTEALFSAFNADEGWDNRWKVKTKINEDHWTVELQIPFKTLRFKADNKVWGIQFFRVDPGAGIHRGAARRSRAGAAADLGPPRRVHLHRRRHPLAVFRGGHRPPVQRAAFAAQFRSRDRSHDGVEPGQCRRRQVPGLSRGGRQQAFHRRAEFQ